MIRKIDKKNKILDVINLNKNYFSIIIDNLLDENFELYSDCENYLICYFKDDNSCLVWTRDNISQNVLFEIIDFVSCVDCKVICDVKLYDMLFENYFDLVDSSSVIKYKAFICNNDVKIPNVSGGVIHVPSIYDMDSLCSFYYDALKECDRSNTFTMEYVRDVVSNLIQSGCIYSWKNDCGSIVSIVSYIVKYNQAVIDNIYTKPDERKNGYVSNLLATITEALLNENMVPIIYLNSNDNAIEKILCNIGYKNTGMLTDFCFLKNKVKQKI